MPLFPPQYFRKTRGEIRIGFVADRPSHLDVLEGTLYFSTDTGSLVRAATTGWENYGAFQFFSTIDLLSGQIKFPATQIPSADPNTFDDYEEGTWTPALNINASTAGITYTSRSGTYTKEARLVEVDFVFVLSSKGASVGAATITGLPFTASVVTTGPIDFATGIPGGVTKIPFHAVSGSTLFPLYYDNVGGRNQATNNEFTNTTTLQGSIVYPV